MVRFLDDYYISDDVSIRHAQIVEVVVSHCAHVLWSKKPEKLHMAAVWAKSLRNAIQKRKDAMKAAMSYRLDHSRVSHPSEQTGDDGGSVYAAEQGRVTTPAKDGTSGLSVASVDAILYKEASRVRSGHRPTQGKTCEELDGDVAEKVTSSCSNGAPSMPLSFGLSSSSAANASGSSSSHHDHAANRNGHAETKRPLDTAGNDDDDGKREGKETQLASSTLANQAQTPVDDLDASSKAGYSTDVDITFCVLPEGSTTTVSGCDVVFVSPDDLSGESLECPAVFLRVKRLSGGITNELFRAYDDEDPSTSVVVRVYGKETERVISRESELFYQSIFLDTYVHGRNFLMYQFLEQYETLPYTDMAKEAALIARAVANFQVCATLAARRDRAPPLIAEESPAATVRHHVNGVSSTRFERESNYTVHSLTTWVDQITSQEIQDKVFPDKRADFIRVAEQLRAESRYMLAILEKQKANLGESVCHNDLLSANIMRHVKCGDLKIIDFDYTKKDFFLFDAANHFNEYTGLECDYARYFPSDEHMKAFVASYRQCMREEIAAAHSTDGHIEEVIPNEWELFWGDAVTADAKRCYTATVHTAKEALIVDRWTALVKFLTLCSHLSWSIWSLVQEAVSQIDMDFLEYSKLRLGRYLETKEGFTTGLGFYPE